MKRYGLLIFLVLLNCADTISSEDLIHLPGYWEIEKVVFPNGDTKEYGLNTTIDYFETQDMKGFRKKVQPKLDGTFITSDDAAPFEILTKSNKFIVMYTSDGHSWEEEMVCLTAEILVMVNEEGITYHYKRFEEFLTQE